MVTQDIVRSAPNILLVENHGPLRSLWKDLLSDHGFVVTAVESADEAQIIIQGGARIDVLFSDIRMPGQWNGLQLGSWVRKQYPSIIVILQTGSLDVLPPEFCILRKPFTGSDFMRTLQEQLQASGKLLLDQGALEG
jgi:CheY-like chemotaxis protein